MTVLRFRPRFVERDPRSKKKSVQLIADEDEDICRATDGFESGEGRSVRAAVEGVGEGIEDLRDFEPKEFVEALFS